MWSGLYRSIFVALHVLRAPQENLCMGGFFCKNSKTIWVNAKNTVNAIAKMIANLAVDGCMKSEAPRCDTSEV